jgi:carbamoyl-phosphate synthase large subunit
VPILGTSPDAIDLAEDRDRFKRLLDKLGLKQPKNGIAYSVEQSRLIAAISACPSWCARATCSAGRAMAIIRDEQQFEEYLLGTLPSLIPPT